MKDQHNLIQHYKSKHEHIDRDFRARSIRELIAQYVEGKKILDAGCGSGDVSRMLAESGHEVTAIDPEREMIEMTKELLNKQLNRSVHTLQTDIDSFARSSHETFDTVICLDVIEHIENDLKTISSLLQMVKLSGTLILSVPAIPWLYGPKDESIGHYRRYSKDMLLNAMSKHNVHIERMRYWNILGVVPTIVSVKVLHKPVSEQFRYRSNFVSRAINTILTFWFENVENHIHPPIGLTLVLVVKKKDTLVKRSI